MVKIIADNMEKVLVDPAMIINGKDGKDGDRGPEGLPGRDGVDGRNGIDGKDGRDGIDGKDGISYWIEYDKKKSELVFKNDGGKKNPAPIKLPEAKGWGYGVGGGRGGVTAQADWNQTDKHAVDYIKNKPVIHNISFKIVDTLPAVGNSWTIYLVPTGETIGSNIYTEWIWVVDEQTQTLYWEQLGQEIDLSGYVQYTDYAGAGHISNKSATNKYLSPSTIDDVASVSARSVYDNNNTISNGTINISEGCVFYVDTPSAATTYTLNTSALTQTGMTYRYINVLINMPSTAVGLDFTTNNTVTWTEDETPDMSEGGKTYLLAFQSFDGGTSWIGSLATWWTTPTP